MYLRAQSAEDAESQQGGGGDIDQDLQLTSSTSHLCSSHEKVSEWNLKYSGLLFNLLPHADFIKMSAYSLHAETMKL